MIEPKTHLTKHKFFKMKKVKLFFSGILLSLNLCAQLSQSFITEVTSLPILNANQQNEYNKILNNRLLKNHHFVSIGNYSTMNFDGLLKVTLSFLPITDEIYQTSEVDYKNEQNYFWYGRNNINNEAENYSTVSITKVNGVFSGNISFENNSFEIHDLSDGLICISELKMDNMNAHECATGREATPILKTTRGPCAAEETRILVIYNNDALSVNGNMQALSQEGVYQLNNIWSQSSIPNNATLAGVQFFNFQRSAFPLDDINNIPNINQIQDLRVQFNADIVVLMIGLPYQSPYGEINGIVPVIGGGANDAFCIVSAATATTGRRTFAHEITHIYGGRHDDPCDNTQTNAHGLIFEARSCWFCKKKPRYTLMACMASGSRIDYISNPSIEFLNKPTGTTSANNSAEVISRINTVANFRQDPALLLDATISWPVISNCLDHPTVTAIPKCGEPPYTYLWQKSTNGINWTNVSVTNTAHIALPQPTGFMSNIFIQYRLILTDALNVSIVKNKTYNMNCVSIGSGKGFVETNIVEDIKIIPNPNNGRFSIATNAEFSGNVRIQISDITGKMIHNQNFTNVELSIDFNENINLATGTYFVKLINNHNESKILKLVIDN
jgi:hypothetical protein